MIATGRRRQCGDGRKPLEINLFKALLLAEPCFCSTILWFPDLIPSSNIATVCCAFDIACFPLAPQQLQGWQLKSIHRRNLRMPPANMASPSFSGALIPYTPREGREIVLYVMVTPHLLQATFVQTTASITSPRHAYMRWQWALCSPPNTCLPTGNLLHSFHA